nr:MAG TPA: hypothetical protein [Caudoviricetes sp.]
MLYLRCEDEPPYKPRPWWRRTLDRARRLFRR